MMALMMPVAAAAAKKAAAKAAPKTATLNQLIDATLRKGEASTLQNPLAGKLGYPAPMPIRDFPIADIAKNSQVGSVVILGPDGKPSELNIALTTVTEMDGENPVAIDGYTYRTDLNGTLISAIHAHGKVANLNQDVLTAAAAKKGYDKLLKTILARAEVLAP